MMDDLRLKRVARAASVVAVAGLVGLSAVAATAKDEKKPAAPDFTRGMLTGKVVDVASGKPIPGATVALQQADGKVIAWTRTDAQGHYAIAADPLNVLHLRPSRRKGLLARIVSGTGKVVGAVVSVPVNAAKGVMQAASPSNVVKSVAMSAATGTPGPLGATVVGGLVGGVTNTTKAQPTQMKVKAVQAALDGKKAAPRSKDDKAGKGEVRVRVIAPGYQEGQGPAGTYWIEPAQQEGDKTTVGPKAFLETVQLARAGTDKKSAVSQMAVTLADAHLDPPLAPLGTPVKLSVKVQQPGEPPMKIRVLAREDKTRQVVELKPDKDNVYQGEMTLDPKMDPGDTTITITALHAQPVEVRLKDDKDDPLLRFARDLDDLDADKPYEYDPRIMASANRMDLKLTVLDPKQATLPAPQAAPPATDQAPPAPNNGGAGNPPAPAAAPAAPASNPPAPAATPPAAPANPPAAPAPAPAPAAPPAK